MFMSLSWSRTLTPSPARGGGWGGGPLPSGLSAGRPPPQAGKVKHSYPLPVEARLDAAAVAFERALGTDCVRALENPVLPGAQAAEDFRLERLGTREAQIGLHGADRTRRKAGACLDHRPAPGGPVEKP